jgi:putative salt-induced outer membrane protein YdiY
MPILCLLMLLVLGLAGLATPSFGAEGVPPKPWKGSAELSFVNANGNTKSSTFSNKDHFEYASGRALLDLDAGALRGTSRGDLTAEQYFASEKVGYKWSDNDYVFERLRWDKDRFAGINNRYDASLGLGRQLMKTVPNQLLVELGTGYVWEERLAGQPRNDYAAGRAYARYDRALSPTSGFRQDVVYVHNYEQARDYRIKTETSVTAAMTSVLSLKTAFVWSRAGRPPPGFIKDDTVVSAALIVSL